jgi:hypothetical protein
MGAQKIAPLHAAALSPLTSYLLPLTSYLSPFSFLSSLFSPFHSGEGGVRLVLEGGAEVGDCGGDVGGVLFEALYEE